jgi:hypothetical protein
MSRLAQARAPWASIACILLLLALIAGLQVKIDASSRAYVNQDEDLLLQSGRAAQRMSLGYDSLVADVYWTRAVQYYGARAGVPGSHFQLLSPLLDIATDLDPKLIVGYRFGAVFLAEPSPTGAGRPDLAIQLVKKGMAANPDNWYLVGDLAFLYYWYMNDYTDAAKTYMDGSKIPGAPSWMNIMAALVAQRGGSVETARMLWTEVYNSTQDKSVRTRAMETLRGLRALEDEQELDRLAQQYKDRFGHFPSTTDQLRESGLIRGNPVDPAGFPYLFGSEGKSALDPQSPIVIPKGLLLPSEIAP